MKQPYFENSKIKIYHGDFRDYIKQLPEDSMIVTDPPYNIGFQGYDIHNDNMPDDDYIEMLCELQRFRAVAIINYPIETIKYIAPALGIPNAVAAWCYNANIPNRFRLISFYGCKPDYSKEKQAYKNPTDKRVAKLIADGSQGTNLYEWWTDIQLVKNVSKEKTNHPCPVPEKLISRIIRLASNEGERIIDPFVGSLTTIKCAFELGHNVIGCEKSEAYILEGLKRLEGKML